jgi:hypothetical protein
MATNRTTSDGIVFDFDHSEVTSLEQAEDMTISTLALLDAAAGFLNPDPITKAIIDTAIVGVAATIAIHKVEFQRADTGNGVEATLPWWAIALQLWGVLIMKPRPPAPPPPPSPDSGTPWTIVQPTPHDAFGNAQSMPSMGTARMFIFGQPAVGSNADGRLEVFAIENGTGRVLHTVQDVPNGSFASWSQLGDAMRLGPIMVISGITGGQEIFAVDTGSGLVWTNWQNGPNGAFEGWVVVGNRAGFRQVTAGRNADGRLEVFAVDTNGVPWHTAQPDPSSGFPDWSQLGNATGLAQIKVISTQSGSLEVFAVDRDAGLAWTIFQDGPNGNWEGWVSIGDKAGLGPIEVGKNADGRLQVFTAQR